MEVDHDTLVAFAKSGGLFYFIAFSIGVLIYTFWPSNRKKFDRAKHDVLDWEDGPEAEEPSVEEQAVPEDRPCR
jgi:cytochrome c oxidase cbb3-type subunit IV